MDVDIDIRAQGMNASDFGGASYKLCPCSNCQVTQSKIWLHKKIAVLVFDSNNSLRSHAGRMFSRLDWAIV